VTDGSAAGAGLVGRGTQAALLRGHLDGARRGAGGLVWLRGEAGIGKTTLLDALGAAAVSDGFLLLRGQGWDDAGTPPFWIWSQVLRDALGAGGKDEDSTPLLRALVDGSVGRVGGTGRDGGRFPLFDAVGSRVRQLAADRPVIVLLDDLQWADLGSLRLLELLARDAAHRSVLLAAAWRTGEAEPDSDVARIGGELAARAAVLDVPGLGPEDVALLMSATSGQQVDPEIAQRVAARTAGNPLYVGELGRLLRDGGTAAADEVVPESAAATIRRRLARLSAPTHRVLGLAAVAGTSATFARVAALAGRDLEDVAAALDEAVAAGLAGSSPTRVQIAHPLVRDVLIGSLPLARRREIHRETAALLLPTLESTPVAAAEVAHHLRSALPLGSREEAVAMTLRAAQVAMVAQAFEEAAGHAEAALDLLEGGERFETLLLRGEALSASGDGEAALATHLDAVELARRSRDPERLGRAALGYAAGLSGFEVRLLDRTQIDLLEEALAALPRDDSVLRADVMSRLSVALSFVDTPQRRMRLATDAVAMARRLGESRTTAHALAAYCDAIADPDHLAEREAASTEVVELATRIGDRPLELLGLRLRLIALLEKGSIDDARDDVRRFARVARALRQPLYSWYVPLWEGFDALLAGDFDKARACADEVERVGALADSSNAATLAFVQRMWVAAEIGRIEEFLAEGGGPLITELDAAPDGGTLVPFYPGQPDRVRREALPRLGEALASAARDAEYVTNLCHVSFSLYEGGDEPEYAALVYDALLPYARLVAVDGIAAGTHGSVARWLGGLATLQGRWDDAEKHFAHAVEVNEALGAVMAVTHTQVMLARMLGLRGRAEDRRRRDQLLTEALSVYRAHGADGRAEKVAAELDGVQAPSLADSPQQPVLARRRDGWRVVFRDEEVTVRHSKGMADLAVLLDRPGQEVHALDLVGAVSAEARARADRVDRADPDGPAGDHGEVLDETARAAYQRRLSELEEDLAEADATGDPERGARAHEERELLLAELSSAYGLGGRARRTGDDAERARSAATWRIRDTIKRLEKVHPALGRHLRASVRTGVFCSYQPEDEVAWTVSLTDSLTM
jgi:tetratricopeptide (TPR) repeat protein